MIDHMDWEFFKTLLLLASIALNGWLCGKLVQATNLLREYDEPDDDTDSSRTGGA